jgi:NUMOD3 motif
MSAESRKKMSLAKMGSTPWNKGVTGYHLQKSDEAKRRTGRGNKGKIHTPEQVAKQSASHSTPEYKALVAKRYEDLFIKTVAWG